MPTNRSGRRRRGFLILDALAGLALLATVSAMLLVTITKQQRASRRLADDRDAVRRVEAALLARADDATATIPEGVTLVRLDAPAPAGHAWARAAIGDAHRVELIGLIRMEDRP